MQKQNELVSNFLASLVGQSEEDIRSIVQGGLIHLSRREKRKSRAKSDKKKSSKDLIYDEDSHNGSNFDSDSEEDSSGVLKSVNAPAVIHNIKPPRLTSSDESHIIKFHSLFQEYERKIAELNSQGIKARPTALSLCIEAHVLDAICYYDLDLDSSENVSDSVLRQFLFKQDVHNISPAKRKRLTQSVEKELTMPARKGQRAETAVTRLFEKERELRLNPLYASVMSEKYVCSLIVQALKPPAMRASVKRVLSTQAEWASAKKNLKALRRLVLQEAKIQDQLFARQELERTMQLEEDTSDAGRRNQQGDSSKSAKRRKAERLKAEAKRKQSEQDTGVEGATRNDAVNESKRGPRNERVFRCINCGKSGHKAADCSAERRAPEDRTCFRCGKQGHESRNCSSKKQERTGRRAATASNLQLGHELRVDGKCDLPFVYDNGCNTVLMTDAQLQQAKEAGVVVELQSHPAPLNITLAGGQRC